MNTTAFGRIVSLVNEKAGERAFSIGLEAIEPGTGHLVADPVTGYEGDGTAFEAGDLLFGKLRPYLAKAWLADRPGAAVGDFHIYRSLGSADSRYLRWVLLSRSFLGPVEASVFGAKMPRANWDFIRKVSVHLPPLDEQRTVAGFLDRETARIDTLIAEQQRLIELLGERRASVVDLRLAHHGLSVPGCFEDYEGRLPSGWRVMLLGRTLEQLTNGFVGPTRDILVDEGIRYIQGTHIKAGRIDFDRRPFFVSREWHDERPRIHLRTGDVLIVQTGDIGKAAVVPAGFGDASCHALQIARTYRDILSGEYLAAFLSSRLGYQSLVARATGALHPHLEAGIRSAPIIVPPLEIQDRVVDEVDEQTAKIDTLIAETERFIELSRERRSALITAAVTGQSDVRDRLA